MVLHTVNQSPHNSQTLADCLRTISAPAILLLIEDGVYGATAASQALFEQLPAAVECYALQADIDARGLTDTASDRFTLIDDAGFVELSVRCNPIQSWY